jgi:hypothetical protein
MTKLGKGLPQKGERYVLTCLKCEKRTVTTTKREAEKARTQHKRDTGHVESMLAWNKREKREAREGEG